MELSNQALSRALLGIVSACLNKPLHDYHIAHDYKRRPMKDRKEWNEEILPLCASAFGPNRVDRFSGDIMSWGYMQGKPGCYLIPFSQEDVVKFACAFFTARMDRRDQELMRREVQEIVADAHQRKLPDSWKLTSIRKRMSEYVAYDTFVRAFKPLCQVCRDYGAANEDVYRLFQETIVRTALKIAEEFTPPSGAQTGT